MHLISEVIKYACFICDFGESLINAHMEESFYPNFNCCSIRGKNVGEGKLFQKFNIYCDLCVYVDFNIDTS